MIAAGESSQFPWIGRQWLILLAVLGATVVLFKAVGGAVPWAFSFPDAWVVDIAEPITRGVKYLANEAAIGPVGLTELVRAGAWVVEQPMLLLRGLLATGFTLYPEVGEPIRIAPVPWFSIGLASLLFASWAGGRRMALLVGVSLAYVLAFGLWEATMATLASVVIAVLVGVALGVLLGVLAYRRPAWNRPLTALYDVMQTLPMFSYLVPVLIFFGFGPVAALVATVIFAMPPMARVTTLALHRLPESAHELAKMTGCTERQRLWLVMLPAARDSLLIGVNQVIMLSLAMVIVASIIGAGGLGTIVLGGLKSLRLGPSIEAGIAITLLAIVLDRLSRQVATRRPHHEEAAGRSWWRRHAFAALSFATLAGGFALVQLAPGLSVFPEAMTVSTAGVWNGVVSLINRNLHDEIALVRDALILTVLKPTKLFLLSVPWFGFCLFTGALALLLGGVSLAVAALLFLGFIAVTGYWDLAMISLYLVGVSFVFAVVIGFPLGLWAALSRPVDRVVTLVIDTLQTLPTFVYLIPVVMLFGIGDFPAMVAIVAYAVPPAIRYTKEGIRAIRASYLEAADLSGCTRRQKLWHVQIPLALPDIMLGMNQTVMMAFGMLVITALVGTRGLEQETLIAIGKVKPGEGLIAGLAISFLSILSDRLLTGASAALRARLKLPAAPGTSGA